MASDDFEPTWERIREIVDFIIKVGTENTETGQYSVYFDELYSVFQYATIEWLRKYCGWIRLLLDSRKETISETWWETAADGSTIIGFDCNFCGAYCPNWQENGVLE